MNNGLDIQEHSLQNGRQRSFRDALRRDFWDLEMLVVLLVSIAAVVVFFLHAKRFFFYTEEDAYIFARYVRNLATGNGLVFNVGEREWGCTSTLLPLLLTPLHWLGIAPVIGAKMIGLASVAGSSIRLARASARHAPLWLAALVPLLIVSYGPLMLWAVGGLETALFIFLVVMALTTALDERDESLQRVPMSAVWLVLATLARVDAPLYTPAILLAGWNGDWKHSLRWLVTFGIGFAAIWLMHVGYYHAWLPNSYMAKVQGWADRQSRGLRYIEGFINEMWLLLATTGTAGLLTLIQPGERRRDALPFALAIILCLGYVFWAGGDWMHGFRFLVPIVLFAAPLLVWSVTSIGELLGDNLANPIRIGAAVGIAVLSISMFTHTASWLPRLRFLRCINETQLRMGTAARGGDPSLTYALGDIGGFSWNSESRILDLDGLTDHTIASATPTLAGPSATEALARRQPDVILLRVIAEDNPEFLNQVYQSIVKLDSQPLDRVDMARIFSLIRNGQGQGDIDALYYVTQRGDYRLINIPVLPEADQFYLVLARQDALTKLPRSLFDTRFYTGIAYYETGQKEKGVELIQQELSTDRLNVMGRVHQSARLLALGKFDQARQGIDEILAIDPRSAATHNNLGLAFAMQGHFAEAIPPFKRAIELDPKLQVAKNNLAWARSEVAHPSGNQSNSQPAGGNSPQPTPSVNSAAAKVLIDSSLQYCQGGQYAKCIDAAERALRISPDNATAYNNISAAYMSMAKWDEAIAAAEQAVRIKPDFQLAKNKLAYCRKQKSLGQR